MNTKELEHFYNLVDELGECDTTPHLRECVAELIWLNRRAFDPWDIIEIATGIVQDPEMPEKVKKKWTDLGA